MKLLVTSSAPVTEPSTPPPRSMSDCTTEFFEWVLGARDRTEVRSRDYYSRGPTWARRTFGPDQAAETAAWVMSERGRVHAEVPVHERGNQYAAAVKVQPPVVVGLALCPVTPTLAVIAEGEKIVYAAWLFRRPVRWFAGSNLSHALARRIGARPTTRIPVPGTGSSDGGPRGLQIVGGCLYDPETIEATLRRTRPRPRRATPRRLRRERG